MEARGRKIDEMRESESCVVHLRERGGESPVERKEKKLLKKLNTHATVPV